VKLEVIRFTYFSLNRVSKTKNFNLNFCGATVVTQQIHVCRLRQPSV